MKKACFVYCVNVYLVNILNCYMISVTSVLLLFVEGSAEIKDGTFSWDKAEENATLSKLVITNMYIFNIFKDSRSKK